MQSSGDRTQSVTIGPDGLQALLDALAARDYRIVGPTLRDDAIVFDDIRNVSDLPAGWTDRQEAGRYSLERRDDGAFFGYAVGPHSWKRFLHPPAETLWTASRDEDGAIAISLPVDESRKFAFLGVRGCDLHAIAIQDRVLRDGPYPDATYASRRRDAFIIVVNCLDPGGTCFCVSMGTGPGVESGFDLALTELVDGDGHLFLLEAGSAAGADLVKELPSKPASPAQRDLAARRIGEAADRMGRSLEKEGVKDLLQANLRHPRWDQVAERCLTCGNCTMVCPTCFCTTIEDHGDLANGNAERVRKWDSCFTLDFSLIHDGSVRHSAMSRYRQWLTHKLANWEDQFGTSGCVGCGRCITWCPVGIDLTEEVAAIRAEPAAAKD